VSRGRYEKEKRRSQRGGGRRGLDMTGVLLLVKAKHLYRGKGLRGGMLEGRTGRESKEKGNIASMLRLSSGEWAGVGDAFD